MNAVVPDFTVETSSVDPIYLKESKEITATMKPVVAGAKVEWFITLDDPADEGYVKVTPNPDDQFRATIEAVKIGGGRVGARITVGDVTKEDSSRCSVKEPPALPNITTDLPATKEVVKGQDLELDLAVDEEGDAFDWIKDGKKLKDEFGGKTTRYYQEAVTAADAGTYWVEVYHREAPHTRKLSTKCVVTINEA